MNDQTDVEAASRAFIASAFGMLKSEYVIPRPFYDAYIAVGRDYEGPGIMALLEYKRLEDQLKADYTSRFPEGIGTAAEYHEYPSTYIFKLLEACVARSAQAENFDLPSMIVDPILIELRTMLEKSTLDVVCTRHVLHLTTVNAQEINLGDITVLPRKGDNDYRGLQKRIQREIAGAARAWNRDVPVPLFGSPDALLVLRRTTNGPDPYKDCEQLSTEIDRFLFLARLLTSGTAYSAYEVWGMPTLIAPMSPVLHKFKGPELPLVRRAVRLTGNEGPAFAVLGDLVDAAEVTRTGMVTTSFDVAIRKFNNSHASGSMYEQIVDLATALEAVLIGSGDENDGISLRLRTRAAALLATENDPAGDLFNDLTQLYSLRSNLVHGGQIKLNDLRKKISKVSTVTAEDTTDQRFGIGLSHAVDRMRDIVRRAILARLCLAQGPSPLWPFQDSVSIDPALADDSNRATWRTRWRDRLTALGVESAANRADEAVDFFQPDDA